MQEEVAVGEEAARLLVVSAAKREQANSRASGGRTANPFPHISIQTKIYYSQGKDRSRSHLPFGRSNEFLHKSKRRSAKTQGEAGTSPDKGPHSCSPALDLSGHKARWRTGKSGFRRGREKMLSITIKKCGRESKSMFKEHDIMKNSPRDLEKKKRNPKNEKVKNLNYMFNSVDNQQIR